MVRRASMSAAPWVGLVELIRLELAEFDFVGELDAIDGEADGRRFDDGMVIEKDGELKGAIAGKQFKFERAVGAGDSWLGCGSNIGPNQGQQQEEQAKLRKGRGPG